MKFDQLIDIAADLHCFSAGMVTAGEDIDAVRVQLSRWVTSKRLVRIHKGWYTLRDPFRRVRLNLNVVACTIKRGSYVSLQSALAYHGMIPEYVAETTCVTTGRPRTNGWRRSGTSDSSSSTITTTSTPSTKANVRPCPMCSRRTSGKTSGSCTTTVTAGCWKAWSPISGAGRFVRGRGEMRNYRWAFWFWLALMILQR